MAIADMSPSHQNTVGALVKGLQQKTEMDPSGAHHPDQADVGRVLNPGNPGQISSGIGTPVAHKGRDPWFYCVGFLQPSIRLHLLNI